MSDYTLRNKTTNPIFTLRPKMLEKLLAARPESSALALAKTFADLKVLLGRRPSLDHDQSGLLATRAQGASGPRGNLMWKSQYDEGLSPTLCKIKTIFESGFMNRTISDLNTDVEMAEQFFDMLDHAIALTTKDSRA